MIYTLLIAHFVADFLCQTDWMAVNKSKRWDALALHVGVYTLVLAVIVAFMQPPSPYPYSSLVAFGYFVFVNGAAHFVQDAITSRITSRAWFFRQEIGVWTRDQRNNRAVGETYIYGQIPPSLVNPFMPIGGNRHWFFVAIGADQLLHYVTLFVTASWWLQ